MNKTGFALLFVSFSICAEPVYVTVEGTVTRVSDNTTSKEISHVLVGDLVTYTVLIDDNVNGFWLSSGELKSQKDSFGSQNSYSDFMFADYLCGNAINDGYFNYEYFTSESTKSYSSERFNISIGKRIDIRFNELFDNLYIGLEGTAKNSYKLEGSKDSISFIESTINIVDISITNPCAG